MKRKLTKAQQLRFNEAVLRGVLPGAAYEYVIEIEGIVNSVRRGRLEEARAAIMRIQHRDKV